MTSKWFLLVHSHLRCLVNGGGVYTSFGIRCRNSIPWKKILPEKLNCVFNFLSPFTFTGESVQLEEHPLCRHSLAISSYKWQCYSA